MHVQGHAYASPPTAWHQYSLSALMHHAMVLLTIPHQHSVPLSIQLGKVLYV